MRRIFEPLTLNDGSTNDCQLINLLKSLAHIGVIRAVAPRIISIFPGGGENSRFSINSIRIACISIILFRWGRRLRKLMRRRINLEHIRESPANGA